MLFELIAKYNTGLKTLLQQGISEPAFYDIQFINTRVGQTSSTSNVHT